MHELAVESNRSNKRPLQRASLLERTKQKIIDAMLVDDLVKFVKGEIDMTTTQANTALRLVNKFMPDLQAVQHDVSVSHNVQDIHTLNAKLSALGHDPNQVWQSIANNQPVTIKTIESEPVDNQVENVNPDTD